MDQSPADLIVDPIPPTPRPSAAHRIFFGRFGMRAGWGIAIFLIICFILTIVAGITALSASGNLKTYMTMQAQAKAHPDQPHPKFDPPMVPVLLICNDSIPFFGMLFACWIFSNAERRRLATYGLGRKHLADFLPGAFWGLALLSLLVLILHTLHLLVFDGRILFGFPIVAYAIKWLIGYLFVGFSEEYQMRGYLQFTLSRGLFGLADRLSPSSARAVSFWLAACVMSCVFGTLHLGNPNENALGIAQVVLVGLVFSYALWRTGSLWWGVGFHMAWDWAQSFLYGVPDSGYTSVGRLFQTHPNGKPLLSGGIDGPEGSVLCVGIMLLVLVVIRFTTTPGVQPPLEPEPKPLAIEPAAV
jgi:uncharacterized protein